MKRRELPTVNLKTKFKRNTPTEIMTEKVMRELRGTTPINVMSEN